MYKITKKFSFSASHILDGLPEGHQCGRLHGHNYEIEIELCAEFLNGVGFVRDYGELDLVKKWIDRNFDHRHLNDQVDFQPSAENLAAYIFNHFKVIYVELSAVTVRETEKTSARYYEQPYAGATNG